MCRPKLTPSISWRLGHTPMEFLPLVVLDRNSYLVFEKNIRHQILAKRWLSWGKKAYRLIFQLYSQQNFDLQCDFLSNLKLF